MWTGVWRYTRWRLRDLIAVEVLGYVFFGPVMLLIGVEHLVHRRLLDAGICVSIACVAVLMFMGPWWSHRRMSRRSGHRRSEVMPWKM